MKSEVQLPDINVERTTPENGFDIDQTSQVDVLGPEVERGAEKKERTSEARAGVADVGLTTALPAPVITEDSTTDDVLKTTIEDVPQVAADDDLIEKEWVDRAKRIIIDTKNDPYKRDSEVSKLKVVYRKKRHGGDLGIAA